MGDNDYPLGERIIGRAERAELVKLIERGPDANPAWVPSASAAAPRFLPEHSFLRTSLPEAIPSKFSELRVTRSICRFSLVSAFHAASLKSDYAPYSFAFSSLPSPDPAPAFIGTLPPFINLLVMGWRSVCLIFPPPL